MRSENDIVRLTVDLPSYVHRFIKTQALLDNLSIKDFIIDAVGKRQNDKKSLKENKISKNQMNAKTIATIRDSIKNHDKLKKFKNAEDMMKYLNAPERGVVKKKKALKK